MIREMYNLVCSLGHNHYSPTPQVWIGMPCGKPFETPIRKDGGYRSHIDKCDRPLHRKNKRRR